MRIAIATLAASALLALAGCGGSEPVPATPAASAAGASANAITTVDGVTLQTSSVALADLNATIAQRYGIDAGKEGLLLLVTVRDAAGNGIEPGDLQLAATAVVLPDPPKPLALRPIKNGDMTDYIGVLEAKAPASVQFKLTATHGGSRADVASTAELYPR
jgi:hypothetical protein